MNEWIFILFSTHTIINEKQLNEILYAHLWNIISFSGCTVSGTVSVGYFPLCVSRVHSYKGEKNGLVYFWFLDKKFWDKFWDKFGHFFGLCFLDKLGYSSFD